MLQPNELRIGNWINTDGKPYRVTQLIGGVVATDDPSMWHDKDSYSPIPLNPELLEKCGFEKYNNLWNNGMGNSIHYDLDNKCIKMAFAISTFLIISSNIQYLHQLQNLYFVLTDTELEIKDLK
jgi:hypothetical protein